MDVRIFIETHRGASYDQVLACARATEAAGFTGIFCSDHYMWQGFGPQVPGPLDTWTTLAGLARETENLRLGSLLTAGTFRHPSALAIQVAQVDSMSGGRIELGLGAGWYEQEHTALGIEFPPLRERMERLREQLEVITGLWGTPIGQTFSYTGEHYRLQDAPALPKPVQDPRPPIIIGGSGAKRTPALAARFADEFNVLFPTVEVVGERRAVIVRACEAVGRDPASITLSIVLMMCCGQTDAELQRRAEATGVSLQSLPPFVVAGRPAEVVDRLAQYAEAGVQRVYLQVGDLTDLDHLALVGEQVVPVVRELG